MTQAETSGQRSEIPMIAPMPAAVMERLDAEYTVHRLWAADDRAAFFAEVGPRVSAVVTIGPHGCPADVLAAAPALELIASYGVGYDAIDTEAAAARGIRVTNTPKVLNDAVAELALGLMIALCRRIPQADRFVRDGRWGEGRFGMTSELTGRTLGILGLGRIGREIARRAQAMKMQVVYCGRTRQPDQPYPWFADPAELARASGWLMIAAPGSAETKGVVGHAVLEALGPDGHLVNIARGSICDEAALIEMLETDGIAGAALDVFAAEPDVPERLRALPNVVLSPHQASATWKTRAAMGELVLANIDAHFAGRPLPSPVV